MTIADFKTISGHLLNFRNVRNFRTAGSPDIVSDWGFTSCMTQYF